MLWFVPNNCSGQGQHLEKCRIQEPASNAILNFVCRFDRSWHFFSSNTVGPSKVRHTLHADYRLQTTDYKCDSIHCTVHANSMESACMYRIPYMHATSNLPDSFVVIYVLLSGMGFRHKICTFCIHFLKWRYVPMQFGTFSGSGRGQRNLHSKKNRRKLKNKPQPQYGL